MLESDWEHLDPGGTITFALLTPRRINTEMPRRREAAISEANVGSTNHEDESLDAFESCTSSMTSLQRTLCSSLKRDLIDVVDAKWRRSKADSLTAVELLNLLTAHRCAQNASPLIHFFHVI